LDRGPLLDELLLEVVDPGLGRGTVHRVGDLLGLAVQRLPRLLPVLGHPGDVSVWTAEDRESTGDALRDRGHGARSVEADQRITPTIEHTPTEIVHQLPLTNGRFEKFPILETTG
jgi:hypothetical protein